MLKIFYRPRYLEQVYIHIYSLNRYIYIYIYTHTLNRYIYTTPDKFMELANLENVHLGFYLAVDKLITVKTPNIFYLIPEYSGLKYSLN